jgi:Xaa-Pro aminopeptidase
MERIEQLQREMASHGLDALFLRLPENVMLAAGWWVQIPGLGIAVVPAHGRPALLVPAYEAHEAPSAWTGDVLTFPAIRFDGPSAATEIPRLLRELVSDRGLQGAAVGYEGSFEAVAPPQIDGEPNTVAEPTRELIRSVFETGELIDATTMLENVKAVKTDHDLEMLRITNEVAVLGLNAFKEHALPGRTEAQIAAEVGRAIVAQGHGYRGARVVRCYPTVWSGPETATGWQYFRSRDRVVQRDDVVMLELGTVVDGYWADHTRTVVAGTASDRQREAMAAVVAAQDAAFAAAVPGATGDDVDRVSRQACDHAGFDQFPHHTGHGVGFRYHEAMPWLTKGSEQVLAANMVVVAEPGIYADGLGGFRSEDDAVVTAAGAVRLAETSYGLD